MKRLFIVFFAVTFAVFSVGIQSVSAGPVVIKFGHAGMSKPNPADEYAEKFKEVVELWSQGEIKVEIYGKAQLGGEQQMTQALQLGTLEMQWIAINNLTPRVRSLGFFNLPYVVSSLEEAYRIHDAAWKHARNWTIKEANVRLIGWEAMGFRAFFNSKRPIYHPSDMKGLVWRVPKDDILVGNYEAWGVNPQPMAWHELFNALTQGVVHGGGNPIDDIVSAKLYEPC
ncbi:MAG: TRAP transporter substrate-binding protein, partial [Deltaproteobacteria bacterium]|nr:TRAP transporter substrate-binding protein [Deltaproteobacteria bacterium]